MRIYLLGRGLPGYLSASVKPRNTSLPHDWKARILLYLFCVLPPAADASVLWCSVRLAPLPAWEMFFARLLGLWTIFFLIFSKMSSNVDTKFFEKKISVIKRLQKSLFWYEIKKKQNYFREIQAMWGRGMVTTDVLGRWIWQFPHIKGFLDDWLLWIISMSKLLCRKMYT